MSDHTCEALRRICGHHDGLVLDCVTCIAADEIEGYHRTINKLRVDARRLREALDLAVPVLREGSVSGMAPLEESKRALARAIEALA